MAKATVQTAGTAPRSFQTVNPATGENGKVYQGHTIEQALAIAADVRRAQISWRRTHFKERSSLMQNAAKVIRDNRDRYAKLMTDEMGKPVTDGLAELRNVPGAVSILPRCRRSFLRRYQS